MRHVIRLGGARGLCLGLLMLMGFTGCSAIGAAADTPVPTATLTLTPTAPPTATPLPSATSTPSPYVPPWPILRRGDGGSAEVFALQRLLRYRGRTIVADGKFGAQTLAAVQSLQVEMGEPVDGLVGPVTWSELVGGLVLREGDTGEAVKAAQYLLRKFGDRVSIDGEFGPTDIAALKAFETAVGLQPDGLIDSITWQALVSFRPSVEPSLSYP